MLDIIKRDDTRNIGRITHVLKVPAISINGMKWRWCRAWFKGFNIGMLNGVNRHMLITGESGMGKSNACAVILDALSKSGAHFLVIDPHDEFAGYADALHAKVYDAKVNAVNPLEANWLTEAERVSDMMSLFRRVFKLGELQAYALQKCIAYTYWKGREEGRMPNLADLVKNVRRFIAKSKQQSESKALMNVEKRLMLLNTVQIKSIRIEDLLSGRSIIALSSLHSNEAQVVYVESILRKIYGRMLTLGKNHNTFYLVIDEAEKVANSTILRRLIEEGRKYGIAIISISQQVKEIEKSIRSNVSSVISFYQREPEEANYTAHLIACGTEMDRYIEVRKGMRLLQRGNAIVSLYGRPPMIVKFNRYESASEYIDGTAMRLASKGIRETELRQRLQDMGHAPEHISNRIAYLVNENLLKSHEFHIEGIHGTWYMTRPKNSAEHDISASIIGDKLAGIGIRNSVRNPMHGPDLVAYIMDSKVAVEYETGTKHTEDTSKMLDSRKEYEYIIVVTNDAHLDECKTAYSSKALVLSLYQFMQIKNEEELVALMRRNSAIAEVQNTKAAVQ